MRHRGSQTDGRWAADVYQEAALGKAYDARLVRRLWAYVGPYRGWFWTAMLCLPLTSAFSLTQPYLLKVGIDRYIAASDTAGLMRIAAFYALAMVGEFSFLYAQYYLTMVVAQRSLAALRLDLIAHLQRLPYRRAGSPGPPPGLRGPPQSLRRAAEADLLPLPRRFVLRRLPREQGRAQAFGQVQGRPGPDHAAPGRLPESA